MRRTNQPNLTLLVAPCYFSLAMRRGSTLKIVLLVGGLSGCGAGASRGDVAAAELEARSAQADAQRERARLIEIEARLIELERYLVRQERACEDAPDTQLGDSSHPPRTDPLRSEGDFLAEARVVAPAAGAPVAKRGGAAPPRSTSISEREHMEQLLEGLREYAFDPRSGLSRERREALRVLLRHDRQLDLMNPWADQTRRGRPLDLMNPWSEH